MGGRAPSIGSAFRAAVNPLKHANSDESFLNMGMPPAPTPGALSPLPEAPGNPANEAAGAARDTAAEDERKRRAGVGRASTVLTGPLGESGSRPSARRTLLGTV